MSPRRQDLDEDDVRSRPARSSRPRTRTRPTHVHAVGGTVVTVDRGRYACRLDSGGDPVVAMTARELGRGAVVVGDRVSLVGDTAGGPDALARVVRVEARTSVLRRTPDDTETAERVVVANADLLVIVAALADPPPQPRLVDRCLVAAYDGGLAPLLCLTKADLADPAPFLASYRPLGLDVVAIDRGADLGPLLDRLRDRTSVFFGSSGVGKSTLVNRLVPDADRAIGLVGDTGRGRHTSSSAVALALPGGGWVVDTPGVRSLGLGAVSPDRVVGAFPDLAEGVEHCPPRCTHLSAAEGCSLDDWVAAGHAEPERLVSLRRLLLAREGADEPG